MVGIGQNPDCRRGRGAGGRGLAASERLATLLWTDAASQCARAIAQSRHDPRHAPDRRRLHPRVRPALRPAERAHPGRPDRRARHGAADAARDGRRLRGIRERRLARETARHRPHPRRRRQRDRGNGIRGRLRRLRGNAARIHGRPAGHRPGQRCRRHRARRGRRRELAGADARGSRAARHLGGECLDHHRPAARRDPPRHWPARARARPRRHRREDRHDERRPRCLVLRLQLGPRRNRLGRLRPGEAARARRGRRAHGASDVDLFHARGARRHAAASPADAGRRRDRAHLGRPFRARRGSARRIRILPRRSPALGRFRREQAEARRRRRNTRSRFSRPGQEIRARRHDARRPSRAKPRGS